MNQASLMVADPIEAEFLELSDDALAASFLRGTIVARYLGTAEPSPATVAATARWSGAARQGTHPLAIDGLPESESCVKTAAPCTQVSCGAPTVLVN